MIDESQLSEFGHLSASESQATARTKRTGRINDSPESLRAYLEQHGVKVVVTRESGGDTILGVSPCPMNSDHKDGAAIILKASGVVGFKCHHNGCKTVRWTDVRQVIDPDTTPTGRGGRPSQASTIMEFAAGCELFHDDGGDAYATFLSGKQRATWPVRSRHFKRWLSREFFNSQGSAPGSQALNDAFQVIEGMAMFDGPEINVHVRVAGHANGIFLDLCNDQWQAVSVGPDGWSIVSSEQVPVKFRRAPGMLALPVPATSGSLDDLRQLFNVEDDDWPLVISWLIGALSPSGPYPVAAVNGEQGSAKTTMGRMLRALVDPNKAPLRSESRDERDLVIAASNGWIIGLDNLSRIPEWLSNALCRISTGGGFATRELFSDRSEVIFDAHRPIIINGITELANRSDLLDRCIQFTLPTIPDHKRRSESEIWSVFHEAAPGILGALLDMVSSGLRNRHSVQLDRLPRMADFARWAVACESAAPWQPGTFLSAYLENRAGAHEQVIEASRVATALRAWAEERTDWTGTASELLTELDNAADERTRSARSWPKSASTLGVVLRRVAPNLREVGVDISFGTSKRPRTITIRQVPQNAVGAVAPVAHPTGAAENAVSGDSGETGVSGPSPCLSPPIRHGAIENTVCDSADSADRHLRTQSSELPVNDAQAASASPPSSPEPPPPSSDAQTPATPARETFEL